ncbi:MAG: hypothetical protein J6M18_04555 [Actinomycetaceae bacterium]|nr:hypothetical protein [Actinomycetaceae bacterium]
MKDFSWLFKRNLSAWVIIAAVEVISIGGFIASWETGEKSKIVVSLLVVVFAQLLIFQAWRESRHAKKNEDDSDNVKENK